MCTPYLCNIILFRNAYLLIKIISPVYSATVVVRANQRARTTRVTAVVAFQHPAAMAGGTAATRSAACGRRAAHAARASGPGSAGRRGSSERSAAAAAAAEADT